MHVEIEGHQFRLAWTHMTVELGYQFEGTQCRIYEKTDDGKWALYATGEAWLHPIDRYNHEVGRKVSLTNALDHHPFFVNGTWAGRSPRTRDRRAQMWSVFLNRRKAKRSQG